jgi:hypothetical protein
MAASAHSWDFLLLRGRVPALPLLRGSASRTSGRTANQSHHNILAQGVQIRAVVALLGRSKIDADILPPRG